MTPKPLSVADAIEALDETLAGHVGDIVVSGTLRGLRARRRWTRCELITFDATRIAARLPVAIPPTAVVDTDAGDNAEVVIAGRFEAHPQYGPVQFVASHITVVDTVGGIVLEMERFMAELESSNLLNANKALAVVESPERIGLIAPLGGGAGGADFRQRLDTATNVFQVVHRHVPMAGPDAPAAIAGSVRELCAAAVHVIVVARGGGAASELAVFDDPLVVAAICASPIPVVVAVGHSTDTTRADEVAHTSLATPSLAAAWLIERRQAQRHRQLEDRAAMRSLAASHATASAEQAQRVAVEEVELAHRRQRIAAIAGVAALVVIAVAILLMVWG